MPPQLRANRNLLNTVMTRHGFRALPQEWWHFTLENEPFPDTYFDFPVK
jgi:D-alanyl-D-alanine dipeptidase